MNSPPDDFETLRKLLALKRYEQPPPGYFRDFPQRVIARLQAREAEAAPGWWARLAALLEYKPAWAAAVGLAVLALYLFGLNLAHKVEARAAAPDVALALPWQTGMPALNTLPASDPLHPLGGAATQPAFASSMDPLTGAAPPPGLFTPGAGLRLNDLRPAGYRLGGN